MSEISMMGHERLLTAKISVWWDIENCPVPRKVDPHHIAQNISSILHHANFRGPATIDVFGDTKVLEQRVSDALSSTGINVNHIPSGKDAADKAILVAMLFWALDNPPPAHMFVISGDGDFANALHRLRLKGYNVLLARPDQPIKPALLGAATSIWYWTSIANGQTCDLRLPEKSAQQWKKSYHGQLPAMSAPVNEVTSNPTQSQPFPPGKLDPDGHQSPSACSDAKTITLNPLLPLENLAQEMVESLRDKIKKALRVLKQDGVMPTEENLQDCLQYWDEQVDIKHFLYKAIEMQEITEVNVHPGNSKVFLPLNTELWGCVSVNDMQHDYPNDIWLDFCGFFCCAKNRELFVKSHTRYEAAHILKDSGPTRIQNLSIGEIIHLLNQSIQKRKWLSIHGKNWSSLTINLLPVMAFAERDASSILGNKAGICETKEDLAACVSNQDASPKLIVLEKLRAWLIEALKDKVDYDISLVPKDFKLATGINLDPKKLGYSKLHLLIQEFSDVVCVKEARKGLKVLCPLSKGGGNSKSAACRKGVPDPNLTTHERQHQMSPRHLSCEIRTPLNPGFDPHWAAASRELAPWRFPSFEGARLLAPDVNPPYSSGMYMQSSQPMVPRAHEWPRYGSMLPDPSHILGWGNGIHQDPTSGSFASGYNGYVPHFGSVNRPLDLHGYYENWTRTRIP